MADLDAAIRTRLASFVGKCEGGEDRFGEPVPCDATGSEEMQAALLAVLDNHPHRLLTEEERRMWAVRRDTRTCLGDHGPHGMVPTLVYWPCRDVVAIAKALGVEAA